MVHPEAKQFSRSSNIFKLDKDTPRKGMPSKNVAAKSKPQGCLPLLRFFHVRVHTEKFKSF